MERIKKLFPVTWKNLLITLAVFPMFYIIASIMGVDFWYSAGYSALFFLLVILILSYIVSNTLISYINAYDKNFLIISKYKLIFPGLIILYALTQFIYSLFCCSQTFIYSPVNFFWIIFNLLVAFTPLVAWGYLLSCGVKVVIQLAKKRK